MEWIVICKKESSLLSLSLSFAAAVVKQVSKQLLLLSFFSIVTVDDISFGDDGTLTSLLSLDYLLLLLLALLIAAIEYDYCSCHLILQN